MTKYRVYAIVYVTKEIATIEADSKEEAIEKGWNHEECDLDPLCWQCNEKYELDSIDEVRAEVIEG